MIETIFNSQARVARLLAAPAAGAVLAVVFWAVCAVAAQSPASTLIVTNTDDSGPGSLRAALAAASAGDVVQLSLPANATILLTSGELAVNAPVTIDGSTVQSLTVSGNHASRVLSATAPLTLRGLTIADGHAAGDGGGIIVAGALTLTGVSLVNNRSAGMGGGVYVGGAAALRDSLLRDNTAQYSGGGLWTQGTLDLVATLFLSNTAGGVGGGAFALGAARLDGGSFQGNAADYSGGGGIYAYTTLDITNTTFLSNTVYGAGGGAFAEGAVTLSGGLFQGNHAAGFGGGLATYAAADLIGAQFVGNGAGSDGGGADIFGAATLAGVIFQGNRAERSGGGLHAWTAHLTATRFVGNYADCGGGATIQGAATLSAGRFQDNRAQLGGGLYTENAVHLSETQFLGNLATIWGGGAYVGAAVSAGTPTHGGSTDDSASDATVLNALFARNTAAVSGAALYLGAPGNVQIFHTTIGGPLPATAPAVMVAAGSVTIQDTIVVSHAVGVENAGGAVVQDYNLFNNNGADTQGSVSGGVHNVTGAPRFVDALLDDYHLGPDSSAVDAGINVGVVRDIDGDLRPADGGFDIGFDERSQGARRVYLPLVDR